MRHRQILAIASVLLAGFVVCGSTWAATSRAAGALRVTVTDLDASGLPAVRSGRNRAGRALQASGCREIDITKEGKSFLFHSLVYRWHHWKRWCWSNGRVTGVWTSAYATNMDANWYYKGLAASSSYFYGANQSGHYSFRQAEMQNCVFKYGCIGSEYPWVKIWVKGDGSYSVQKGS